MTGRAYCRIIVAYGLFRAISIPVAVTGGLTILITERQVYRATTSCLRDKSSGRCADGRSMQYHGSYKPGGGIEISF